MANLCIIPARGGSKRIPRKNIKDFLGKPIITYSISAALDSDLFDEVMVSTDDQEIAEIAIRLSAKVPFFRSIETSNDVATTYQVLEEVLLEYEKMGRSFDNICCIYPCAPFVTSEKLSLAYQTMLNGDFDGIIPVVGFGFPIQRALKLDNQKISFFYPEHALTRSQDLEKSYHDAGQFYWSRISSLQEQKRIITNNTGSIVLSELEVQDIDNEIDWELAELKYKMFCK
ncbi:MAG TPA: pseudaminic acid cytidylyltransferase [Saprospiraceae bacterium]|nr:pseudaminic acid cytidylyltransferase [Saprospiraceae bacterium]HMU03115.1 pseudaminic acid cytidylyltransferase [Saprospiraceae bacterium]